jgi:23S rRNA (cytosine1962-C5)-methyltransferase
MSSPPAVLIFDKPSGVAAHAIDRGPGASPSSGQRDGDGFVEALARLAEWPLRVAHHLDKGASGALAIALSREAAAAAAAAFAEGRAIKKYLFITDGASDRAELEVASRIERERGAYFSRAPAPGDGGPNARTRFRRLRQSGRFSLWQALPSAGKSHQIRLHAQDAGIPIVGDGEHRGAPFARLLLHAEALDLEMGSERASATCEPPLIFRDLSLLERPRLAEWLCARDRRERWMRSRAQALRLSREPQRAACDAWRAAHVDCGPFRSERLGPVEWMGWFAPRPPSEADWDDLRAYLRLCERSQWLLQHRIDRGGPSAPRGATGAGPAAWASEGLPERWTATENGALFEFRRDQGLSPGLFLDQRANRLWALKNGQGRRVLNLFCYTAGFSACAALGGARAIVSSDLSRAFLDWGKRNFELNGIPLDRPAREAAAGLGRDLSEWAAPEFRAIDSREYLKWAAKKGLRFDLVVCDPPSFSRSANGVFRVERDIGALVEGVAAVLAPGGQALVSSNFEGWSQAQFERSLPSSVQLEPAFPAEWDFEGPREPRQMKCVFARKKAKA